MITVTISGHEMASPTGARLGAALVIATQMQIAAGCYTGQVKFCASGPAQAQRVSELAPLRSRPGLAFSALSPARSPAARR